MSIFVNRIHHPTPPNAMMKCKSHFPSDLTSSLGVCASCLRDRLLSLLHSPPLPIPPPDPPSAPPPPTLLFPRSVSPYVSRRKSETATASDGHRHHQLFFSTPQAGPFATTAKKKKSKLHFLSNLFRSGSSKSRQVFDPSVSGSNHDQIDYASTSSSSSSWISGFGRRKKSTLRLSSLDETSSYGPRRGRGMSPDGRHSPEPSRWTPSSAHGVTRPSQPRVKASPARTQRAGGIGFCLSPLIRPSPSRHWTGLEAGFTGPQLSTAASLRANRSRKLADFGKLTHDR